EPGRGGVSLSLARRRACYHPPRRRDGGRTAAAPKAQTPIHAQVPYCTPTTAVWRAAPRHAQGAPKEQPPARRARGRISQVTRTGGAAARPWRRPFAITTIAASARRVCANLEKGL